MRNHTYHPRFRLGPASTIRWFLPMVVLVTSTVMVVCPGLAQNGTSQTAPPSQSAPEYWTEQQMRSAKPAMQTVPGTPHSGSVIARPSGPPDGAPGQGPQVQPNPGDR